MLFKKYSRKEETQHVFKCTHGSSVYGKINNCAYTQPQIFLQKGIINFYGLCIGFVIGNENSGLDFMNSFILLTCMDCEMFSLVFVDDNRIIGHLLDLQEPLTLSSSLFLLLGRLSGEVILTETG